MPGNFIHADEEVEVAMTLACCKTLVHFEYSGLCPSFCVQYCAALSNNVDSKLEKLRLHCEPKVRLYIDGELLDGPTYGIEPANVAKIRNLLKLNVRRTTTAPLFAAIGDAESDAKRKQCLVEAFEAVDIPLAFEYITTNQHNLIELIQRLGRSRKRQRED